MRKPNLEFDIVLRTRYRYCVCAYSIYFFLLFTIEVSRPNSYLFKFILNLIKPKIFSTVVFKFRFLLLSCKGHIACQHPYRATAANPPLVPDRR